MSSEKRISNDKYRVIKISKEAHFDIRWDTGEFIAITRNMYQQWDEMDTQLLLKNMQDTTSTMFDEDRYAELTLDEIQEIQNRGI